MWSYVETSCVGIYGEQVWWGNRLCSFLIEKYVGFLGMNYMVFQWRKLCGFFRTM